MDALFSSVSTIITEMLDIIATVTLGLLKNWIFILIIGVVILGIIIKIIFKIIQNTFYYDGKRIKGYAYWRPTNEYPELGTEPVRISRREFKRREKRGEEVTYILDIKDFDVDDDDLDFYN